MTDIAAVDEIVQLVRGEVASMYGQTWDIYRLSGSSNGRLYDPGSPATNRVITGLQLIAERESGVDQIEVDLMVKVPMFAGNGDVRALQAGDLLVSTGYRADGTMLTFTGRRPPKNVALFAQTAEAVTFSRFSNTSGSPVAGGVAAEDMARDYEAKLVLSGGIYSWGAPTSTPAVVYVGLDAQMRGEVATVIDPKLRHPDDVKMQSWHIFSALLPDATLRENDVATRVTTDQTNGDRFSAINVHAQSFGLVGIQIIASHELV